MNFQAVLHMEGLTPPVYSKITHVLQVKLIAVTKT